MNDRFTIIPPRLCRRRSRCSASARKPALAQGFAGLGMTAEGFAPVIPGKVFSFPADLGPHPDYRIEWWYVTANLVIWPAPPMARNGPCFVRR